MSTQNDAPKEKPDDSTAKAKPAPRSFWWHIAKWWSQRDSDPDMYHPGESHEKDLGWPENPRWSSVWALFVTAGVTVGILTLAVILLGSITDAPDSPELKLSLVFVAAGVILILVVCTLTIVFRRLLLSDPDEPMGLPRGSVRAVIALLLIMLFFIAVIFLFNSTRNPIEADSLRRLNGISQARFDRIPTDLIKLSRPVRADGRTTYNVVLLPTASENTPTSDDLAKQLVTTLATLVTAVAAFYFGAGHVQSALERKDEEEERQKRQDLALRRQERANRRQERETRRSSQPREQAADTPTGPGPSGAAGSTSTTAG